MDQGSQPRDVSSQRPSHRDRDGWAPGDLALEVTPQRGALVERVGGVFVQLRQVPGRDFELGTRTAGDRGALGSAHRNGRAGDGAQRLALLVPALELAALGDLCSQDLLEIELWARLTSSAPSCSMAHRPMPQAPIAPGFGGRVMSRPVTAARVQARTDSKPVCLGRRFSERGCAAHDPVEVVVDDRVLEAGKNVGELETILERLGAGLGHVDRAHLSQIGGRSALVASSTKRSISCTS